ncbi:uncharacterized protein N7500_003361 [Penicillium coprophilum]|uniref:uncharacterized protein n=1 Tax=Penicillium coprophilum TaxID=36646 RepID=UPI00238EBC68|nr:uncharacterized protein N7500_003361 [Penicillium coprophilum]KAJ5170578.1 hypothetical protein N7500_003361 [Penicillium coprophilum]
MLLPTKPETLWPGDFQHRAAMSIHGAHIPVSCIGSFDIAGFGRAAQAAWLLDKVFKAFEIPSLNSRLAQLEDLDITIQTFLVVLLQQCNVDEKSTDFCQAIAMSIRALFVIHKRQTAQVLDSEHRSTEKWQKRSHTVLDTATTMVRDIVEAQEARTWYLLATRISFGLRWSIYMPDQIGRMTARFGA